MSNANNKLYMNHGVKWGILQFLFSGLLYFVVYYINIRFALSTGKWLFLAISLTILVIQGLQARSIDGGWLTYGDAFKTLFIACAVSSALFVTSDFVVKTVSPALAEEENTITIERTAEQMADWGATEEKIEETIEKMEEQSAAPTVVGSILKFVGSLLFNTILILIISIFVKKKNKNQPAVAESSTE